MANTVEIILKATDQASGSMNKLNASFKSLTGFSLGAAGGIALAGKAMQAAIQYTKEAIENNDKYVTTIVDMARFTGDQVDQMSRLVQVADDAFLSQEALNNAMSIGAKKGLDMSVAGIKRLADEYNALATVSEKNKLLNDNFGRSGLAMGKLLEQGSAGITKNMEAIADSLVVTDAIVKSTFEYKRSIDAVKDAQDALNYSVAQGTMPALTKLNVRWADFLEVIDESETITKLITAAFWMLEGAIQGLDIMVGGYTTKEEHAAEVMEEYNRIAIEHRGVIEDVELAMSGASLAIEDTTNKSKEMLSMVEQLTGSSESYKEGLAELDKKLKEGTINQEEYKTGVKGLATEVETATRKMILAYTEQLLAQDGLTTEEIALLVQKGEEWGIYADGAWEEMQGVIEQAGLLADAINGIPSSKTINIHTIFSSSVTSGPTTTGSGAVIGGSDTGGIPEGFRADGGPVMGGSPYVVGEAGPELFVPNSSGNIVPNNRLGNDDKLIKAVRQMAYDPYENARVLTDYLIKSGR